MASAIPKDIKASLYIDGKPAVNSLKDVEQGTQRLNRELRQLTPGTDAFNKKLKEVAANKKYLKEVQNEVNGVSGAFGQLKAELGKIGTLAAAYLGFEFITGQFANIISGNAKLSDSLADVRRLTGLTEAGVLDLDKSLGKIDTRTSKSGLREIAVVAGKLGVAKDEILSFVSATDKLVVALGDELGDADAITTTLGKILNVFDGKVTGDNITTLGNAMVKLANDGVASAGFISEFTQKVSGMAKTAGVSLPATLAIGAGLEELGAKSDTAASSMQMLLVNIGKDLPKAAKIAGLSQEEFAKLLPEQQLLSYAKGLAANKEAFADVAKAMGDAGENGVKVQATLSLLGQNTEFFTSKINDASLAIQGSSEINDAFALKNQNLGAQVDKLGKDFNALATNKTLVDFLTTLVHLASDSIKWLKENSSAIGKFTKVIAVGATAWLGYKSAVMLTGTWTAIVSGYMATHRTVTLLLALAQATLAGNTGRAAAAQRLLGLSMVANPFGAVLAVVGALIAAYVLFSQKVTTAAQIQGDFNDIRANAQKAMLDEQNSIKALVQIINSETASRLDKLTAVNKLRNMMPEYLKQYSDEEILAGKAIGAINKYVAALERKTLAEAAQAQIKKLQEENISLSTNDGSTREGVGGALNEGFQAIYGAIGYDSGVKRLQGYNKTDNKNKIQSNSARIKEIQSQFGSAMYEQAVTPDPTGATGGTGSTAGTGSTTKNETKTKGQTPAQKAAEKAKQEAEKIKKEAERLRDDLKKIEDDIYKNSLSNWTKEIAAVETKYDELRKRANGNKADLAAIDKLQAAEQKAIEAKITAESEKEAEDSAQKIIDARAKIFDATASEYEIEYMRTMKHYDDLIKLAEQYGLDTTDLKQKQLLALMAVDDKKAGKKTPEQITADNLALKQEETDFYINSAQQVSDTVGSILSNKARAESERKLSALQKERDAELSNKNLTEAEKLNINAKFDAKVKAEKKRAWEAEQKAAIAQALINGALAATKVLAQTGVLSPFALPAIAVATLANIALISSQKAPEYAQGGMTDEDPAGYVSNATIFNRSASGRSFVAGEKGREWIAPNWMLNNPATANIIGTLEVARKEKRMFANGGFNNTETSTTAQNNGSPSYDRLEGLLFQFISAQNETNKKPVVLDYRGLEEYKANIEKARIRQTG